MTTWIGRHTSEVNHSATVQPDKFKLLRTVSRLYYKVIATLTLVSLDMWLKNIHIWGFEVLCIYKQSL